MTRLITVALTGTAQDRAALDWAAADAEAGDTVHVTLAYRLLALSESSWPPVTDANTSRRHHAQRAVSSAIAHVRLATRAGHVDGEPVVGAPVPALRDISALCDVVVVGVPAAGRHRHAHPGQAIATDLARHGECPVIAVPSHDDAGPPTPADAPVGLLLDASSLPSDAVEFAFEAAARADTTLVVAESVPRHPQLATGSRDRDLWAQLGQETLAADLAVYQDKFRGAGIIVELRHERATQTAVLLEGTCRLVVVSRGSMDSATLSPLAVTALDIAQCPVAVVPE